jgi:hypothetical protein
MHHKTALPWETKVKGTCYGTDHSYQRAAEWLSECIDVADWGGGRAHFRKFLPGNVDYMLIDGTDEGSGEPTRVENLALYHEESDGILLRHVLEMTHDWSRVLENAVAAFKYRMAVITFTPIVAQTRVATHHLKWPVYHFNHERDLLPIMHPFLKEIVFMRHRKTLPEHLYLLEKP